MPDNCYLIVEDAYRKTHWCEKCLAGITSEAKRKRVSLADVSVQRFADISGLADRSIVILLGTHLPWLTQCLAECLPQKAHCILISFPLLGNLPNISHISMDYADATRALTAHLRALSKTRIALFGLNPASVPDKMKLDGFLATQKAHGAQSPEKDVFYNTGSIGDACRTFLEKAPEYDAAICVNDILALALVRRLKDTCIRIPRDLHLATFGTSPLSYAQLNGLNVMTAQMDFEEVGRQAIHVSRLLSDHPSLSSLSAFLSCKIYTGAESDAGEPPDPPQGQAFSRLQMPQVDFYGDMEANNILRMEKFLSECDEIDISLIRCLMQNMTYGDIAETLFISEGTVNYRLKKLFAITHTGSREEFVAFWSQYQSL